MRDEHIAQYEDDPLHWKHVLEALFIKAVEKAGFTPVLPVANGSDLIQASIIDQLVNSEMMLCDLSTHNPNVFFELGVRTSLNLPVALVRDSEDVAIPFDVSAINTYSYDPSLRLWNGDQQTGALADHIRIAHERSRNVNQLWRYFGIEKTAEAPVASDDPTSARLEVIEHMLMSQTAVLKETRELAFSAVRPQSKSRSSDPGAQVSDPKLILARRRQRLGRLGAALANLDGVPAPSIAKNAAGNLSLAFETSSSTNSDHDELVMRASELAPKYDLELVGGRVRAGHFVLDFADARARRDSDLI